MTYEETLQYLYRSTPVFEHVGTSAYKEGLGNTLLLDEHYGHPHRHFQTIHVAGTNGKGSVSHTLAAILQAEGLKVGLYTSPHLVDFAERIRINGKPIRKDYVIRFVEDFARWNNYGTPSSPRLHPSFFELTTAMAFRYFADEQVDIAVVEVGLGGRLDCTNIISPLLSVITNISMDHTNLLGSTLEQIAMEKAGIIKKDTPVVIGETTPETKPVFLKKAAEMRAPVFFAENFPVVTDCDFQLKGSYQQHNLRTVLCAVEHLPEHLRPTPRQLSHALANVCDLTGLQGRWQVLAEHPLIVCDTGHNVAAWEYLSEQLRALPARKLHIVFGMVDDKDISKVLALLPEKACYYWTQAATHRAIPVAKIKQLAAEKGLKGAAFDNVWDAFLSAKSHAGAGDAVFIGGSNYVVGNFLTHFQSENK